MNEGSVSVTSADEGKPLKRVATGLRFDHVNAGQYVAEAAEELKVKLARLAESAEAGFDFGYPVGRSLRVEIHAFVEPPQSPSDPAPHSVNVAYRVGDAVRGMCSYRA